MLKKLRNNKIGVFDSGLGGLTVLKSFLKMLPNYSYVYLGDTARVPYGDKSPELIYKYTIEALEFLFKKDCQLVIIACNTASSQALRKIQKEWLPKNYPNNKVLGVVAPLVEAAAKHQPGQKIGIIGTSATINSKAYILEIKKLNPHLKVIQQSAPLLVPLIESGYTQKAETAIILENYLKKFKKINTLILACTHYPYLRNKIQKILGKDIWVPDPGKIVALSLKDYLKRHNMTESKKISLDFYTTDNNKKFKELSEKFLNKKIQKIQKIKL